MSVALEQETEADVDDSDDQEEEKEKQKEKQWQTYLPFITREMAGPIFSCFIKRANAVLCSIDFSAPHLPLIVEAGPNHLVSKLTNLSLGLSKMYDNVNDESQRKSFLEIVSQNKVFVYFVIQLACKAIQCSGDDDFQVWFVPLVKFLELILMSSLFSDDVNIQLEKQGLFMKIVYQLGSLTVDVVQNLTEESVPLQTILLCVQILFHCAVNSSIVYSLCVEKCSQALLLLLNSPSITLRLITKSFLSYLLPEHSECVLKGDEIVKLIDMLTSMPESLSSTDLSLQVLLEMIKYLADVAENTSLLLQREFLDLISPLADRLAVESEKKILEELLQKFQSGSDFMSSGPVVELDQESSDFQTDGLPEEFLASISPAEAAVEFTELLLRFLMKTLLPYEGIPLEKGRKELSDATWYTISECCLLMAWIINESDDRTKMDIIRCAASLPGCCKSMQLAVCMGTIVGNEGLPKTVMSAAFDELMIVMLTLSDDQQLAKEIARSGFVQIFTSYLITGLHWGSVFQWLRVRLVGSLYILYNLSRDPSNYPAFFFSNAIDGIIPYTYTQSSDLAPTAKFILSFLHMHLDCDQLLALRFSEEELKYCINSLKSALDSPDFQADAISVDEFLQILIGATHPSLFTKVKIPFARYLPKKKRKAKSKKSRSIKLGYFDEKMNEVAEELVKNCFSLIDLNIFSLLENILRKEKFQTLACKLLWNLLHHENISTTVLSDHPGIYESLELMKVCKSQDAQLISHCSLWLLGASNKDPKGRLRYAQGCYKFRAYAEAEAVCSELIESISSLNEGDKQIECSAKLLKGKAIFHGYQRKLMYYMVKKSEISKQDERKLINECFQSISEVINHLGTALDEVYIDQEGSRLLDWAMIDCVRETNWLIQCNRCLLCRRFEHLSRSHVFPRFQLEQSMEGKGIFGHDKHQLKSPGECWIWLCCQRCEKIMSQNAENEFAKRFPSTGSVEYTSWLHSYCCTILFRTLTCIKFPLTFNDDEIYEAFLSCRKHLLSLPVKMKNVDLTPTEMEIYQMQLLSAVVTKEIKPFIFVLPDEIFFERRQGVFERGMLNANTICFLSFRRLIDGHKDLARQSHFFVAYSKGIIILLPFSPSAQCVLPKNCCISHQSGTYTIPDEKEASKLIPKGLWELHHSCALEYFQSLTDALRQITPGAADKMILDGVFADLADLLGDFYNVLEVTNESDNDSRVLDEIEPVIVTNNDSPGSSYNVLAVPFPLLVDKPQISMLPPDFKILHSLSSIQLPKDHQIVLHHIEESCNLTIFLVVGDSEDFSLDKPYVIYLFENSNKTHSYVDAVFIEEVGGEIFFTNFLLEHSLYKEVRAHLTDLQEHVRALVFPMLSRNRFLCLQMFIHYLKCRWFSKDADILPSLGLKCSPAGCWYCKDLCHYCMKPALWIKICDDDQLPGLSDQQFRFCSKKCNEFLCVTPSVSSKSMFVIDHQFPSILSVIKISKQEDSTHNTVEVLNLCIRDCSKGQPQKPYILWQVRLINSQLFRSFLISNECVPVEMLWPHPSENEETVTSLEAYQPYLNEILKYSLKEFGCDDLVNYFSKLSL